jgi:hypothetical protein
MFTGLWADPHKPLLTAWLSVIWSMRSKGFPKLVGRGRRWPTGPDHVLAPSIRHDGIRLTRYQVELILGLMWEVEFTDEFGDWWSTLTLEQQAEVRNRIDLLAERGPALGRPTVDTITGSRIPNLKELRTSAEGALRVLFVFDPRRTAILLLGGDKTGEWTEWYRWAIPEAEKLYQIYLEELREEGCSNEWTSQVL